MVLASVPEHGNELAVPTGLAASRVKALMLRREVAPGPKPPREDPGQHVDSAFI